MKKSMLIICSLLLFAGSFIGFVVADSHAAEKTIKWDLSLWGGRRGFTIPIEQWAADMKKQTNGKWQITIHYGGVLSPPKENLDGLQAGMFESATICSAYTPGKIPLMTVADLPFIAPYDNESIGKMLRALFEHKAIKKEFSKWNAIPLLPGQISQYHIMGNKPVKSVKDLDGLRIRSGGEVARVLKQFGAVPAMIGPSEMYEALDRGTVDAIQLPWYGFGAYRIFEISKYTTPLSVGSLGCAVLSSKDAWDALPDEYKKLHKKWAKNSPKKWADQYKKAEDKWMPIFHKKLEFIKFPESERNKLIAKASDIYEKWVKDKEEKGLPGREILNFYLAKRKEITGK